MNKEVKQIGLGILGGMVVRGVGGVFPATTNPKIVHGGLAIVSGFGAYKVTNPDLKAFLMGGAIIKGIDLLKSVFSATPTAQSLSAKTDMMSNFLKSATGLGCPADDNGLNAVMLGSDGKYYEYDETGLQGTFIDENGQVIHIEDGLNSAYVDENGQVVYVDGLNGYEDEDDDGLNGADEEEYALMGADDEFNYM